MGINLFDVYQKYTQFQDLLSKSKNDPRTLLNEELKRRNMTQEQIENLINQAKQLSKILGIYLMPKRRIKNE